MTSLRPCQSCQRHVRATERACPFCGQALSLHEPVAELRLLTRLDRGHLAALGAVLTAAGILIGCQERPPAAVAIYGAPPPPAAPPAETPSATPPSVIEPAPSASAAVPSPSAQPSPKPVPVPPAPKTTATAQPQNAPPGAPAAAYGAPPKMPGPGDFRE